jgi:hypothetical protein
MTYVGKVGELVLHLHHLFTTMTKGLSTRTLSTPTIEEDHVIVLLGME